MTYAAAMMKFVQINPNVHGIPSETKADHERRTHGLSTHCPVLIGNLSSNLIVQYPVHIRL
jgi:hypothetical protein